MAATLVLDTITSSGAGITIDATKTFTVNGSLLSAGSTNILYKTIDHPIVEADVSGKSELIVTTTPASPRDITLPLVSVTGADTCIITVAVTVDATGTQSVRVMNGASEAWTGHQKGDFVKFCVSNGVWQVLDHKETYYSYRYLTSNLATAVSTNTKMTGWTNVTEIGNAWDNANNKLTTPTGMNGYWTLYLLMTNSGNDNGNTPRLYLAGSSISVASNVSDGSGGVLGGMGISGEYYATSTQAVEFYCYNARSNVAATIAGGSAEMTHFVARFNRTY
jgi:hypothetical protein